MRRIACAMLVALVTATLAVGTAFAQEGDTAATETLSGVFTTIYEDPRPGSGKEADVEYTLTEDSGQKTELLVDGRDVEGERGGLPALDGERVEVQAAEAPGEAVEVQEISPDEPTPTDRVVAQAAAQVGSRPTATILCRFADSTGTTPKPKSHFDTLMGAAKPGMDHYWQESTYGKLNLAGSGVFGWYDLPNPESYYKDSNGNMLEDRLTQDCTGVADQYVTFPNYTNINIIVNTYYSNYALGGTDVLNRDGQNKVYGFTWMPRWGYQKETNVYGGQYILAHEMGHSFGLPHSSGPHGQTYDSKWDVMSNGSTCSAEDANLGCIATHTISAHKDKAGWLDASRKYAATTAANQTVTLERIAQPGTTDYLMAKIPIAGSTTRFYTVEARRLVGYDDQTPADAVIIHKVDTTNATGLTPIAKVVDPNSDNNNNVNDASARWLPGETFTDAANNISVRVDGPTASGYAVTINPQASSPLPTGDPTPPTVESRSPSAGTTGVRRATNVTATFSEDLDSTTLTGATVTLTDTRTGSTVLAAVRCASPCRTVTLDPSASLAKKTKYVARITSGTEDKAGNALAADATWSFTTGRR